MAWRRALLLPSLAKHFSSISQRTSPSLEQHIRLPGAVASSMSASTPSDGKTHIVAKMPTMVYGTAWKKERTADLVYEAIKAGFHGIDTAAMKRHYDEAGTGEGIRRAIQDGLVTRENLWVPSLPGQLWSYG